jgi:hypothetical protein
MAVRVAVVLEQLALIPQVILALMVVMVTLHLLQELL